MNVIYCTFCSLGSLHISLRNSLRIDETSYLVLYYSWEIDFLSDLYLCGNFILSDFCLSLFSFFLILSNIYCSTTFSQNSFTDIYLTNAKTHGIIIKLSHESESRGNLWITETVKRIGRSTGNGWSCSRKVHLTKCLKCGRMNRLTVLDRLLRKRERKCGMNFSS